MIPFMRMGFLVYLLVTLPLCGLPLQAQGTTAETWARLSAANNLDNDGARPFHLVMSYQLYDLLGSRTETGTVEEWWASGNKHRVIIQGPSFPSTTANAPSPDDDRAARARYLVGMLLNAAVHPVARLDLHSEDKVQEETRRFGKTSLRCLKLESESVTVFRNVCREMDTNTVRLMGSSDDTQGITRNVIGTFHAVTAATQVTVSLMAKTAISGEITTLEGIDPAQHWGIFGESDVAETASSLDAWSIHAPGVRSGKLLTRAQPVYPPEAKARHLSGAVILLAVIAKSGEIRHLVPLAMTDPIFVGPAMEASKKWKYEPYLLNGEPVEVTTTITHNFTITHR